MRGNNLRSVLWLQILIAISLAGASLWAQSDGGQSTMLSGLVSPHDYIQKRASSYDRTGGNADFRTIAPGEPGPDSKCTRTRRRCGAQTRKWTPPSGLTSAPIGNLRSMFHKPPAGPRPPIQSPITQRRSRAIGKNNASLGPSAVEYNPLLTVAALLSSAFPFVRKNARLS